MYENKKTALGGFFQLTKDFRGENIAVCVQPSVFYLQNADNDLHYTIASELSNDGLWDEVKDGNVFNAA